MSAVCVLRCGAAVILQRLNYHQRWIRVMSYALSTDATRCGIVRERRVVGLLDHLRQRLLVELFQWCMRRAY